LSIGSQVFERRSERDRERHSEAIIGRNDHHGIATVGGARPVENAWGHGPFSEHF
jgi:hypothetical protein